MGPQLLLCDGRSDNGRFHSLPVTRLGCARIPLQESLKAFHRQPLAWLRLAECCVQHHLAQRAALHGTHGRLHTAEAGGSGEGTLAKGKTGNKAAAAAAAAAGTAVAAAVGKSHFRRLVVPPTLLEPGASVQVSARVIADAYRCTGKNIQWSVSES
jgi:hypothetical protein